MYSCQYLGLQNSQAETFSDEEQSLVNLSVPDLPVPSGARGLLGFSDGHLSVPPSPPISASYPASPASCFPSICDDGPSLNPQSSVTLDSTEFSLLSHFLTHTSQTVPYDHVDLYALSVGIPNLAFYSKPVMSSLLSLAAACKCHDIARRAQNPMDPRTLAEIRDLLAFAERHHGASLQHIQAAILTQGCYDNVLANAALMVLYTSASHAVRVHLTATAQRTGQQLPIDVLLQHSSSHWILFTRAAHTASMAVLNNHVFDAAKEDQTAPAPAPSPAAGPSRAESCSTAVLCPQGGPSESTRNAFLPVVASTYVRALEGLRRKAESTLSSSSCSYLELQACLETLPVLEMRASTALGPREGSSNEGEAASAEESMAFGGNSRVSEWIGKYMVRVTSMTSSTALRRIVMSFLNLAPVGYLNLVQTVLDLPSDEVPSLDAAHLLAMDIFAHWLVLVMLLDGVWWIGEIGHWELGKAISLIKSQNWLDPAAHGGQPWWPESMYLVKRELTCHS
ncbi:hypothetical protein ACO1O0_004273 [Amphichorda felina]